MAENFPVKFAGAEYNIEKFLRDHPGGVNTLKYYKGKNVLNAMEKVGHSSGAYHMLGDFKVSEVDVNLTGAVSENGRIITEGEAGRDLKEVAFLEELEGRLDWSKPLLHQLDAIAPHYDTWVNSPVYRKCRLFENSVLESMTCTPWFLVPMFWIPVILYLLVTQFRHYVACGDTCDTDWVTAPTYLFHLAYGILIWTVVEYSLHRWLFHLNPGKSVPMIKLHFLIHGLHHKVPFDGLRQVFPPIPALLIGSIIYLPIQVIFTYPVIKLTGGIIGYLTYDMIHYYVHHGSPKDGSYLYAMKRYHSNHHFVNHDKAYGISSKLWDYVFKTFVQVRQLGFSLQW